MHNLSYFHLCWHFTEPSPVNWRCQMFNKIGTESVLAWFGDGTVTWWKENCVKAQNINISKIILLGEGVAGAKTALPRGGGGDRVLKRVLLLPPSSRPASLKIIYLILTEFEVRNVSAKRADHKWQGKKTRIRNLQYGPRRRVRYLLYYSKIFIIPLSSVWRVWERFLSMERLRISGAGRKH